jgi:hypothetical protein
MNVQTFVTALEAVKWTDTKSIEQLVSDTYVSGLRAASERIYLGVDNDIRYYLDSKLPKLRIASDFSDDKGAHPYILELRNFNSSSPPFNYGFPLGSLAYFYHDPNNTNTDQPEKLQSTPFRVFLDVVGKSIWLVLDSCYQNELGDEIDIPLRSNAWDYLPSAQNGRNLFTAFMLQSLHDLSFVPNRNSFFANVYERTTSAVDVRLYIATTAGVDAALKPQPASPAVGA